MFDLGVPDGELARLMAGATSADAQATRQGLGANAHLQQAQFHIGTPAHMPTTDVFLVYESWDVDSTGQVAKVYDAEDKAREYVGRAKREHASFDVWYEKRAVL